ncbi:unnamed protein product [Phyllotreta striolata]|uniref:Gag-like protein n=1 Tax=Phyllotreta striolata TaxID=444603 RepID=A0A9N9XM96_PHYSR|nr:unnamed protein product [Phyllotreta striolata]
MTVWLPPSILSPPRPISDSQRQERETSGPVLFETFPKLTFTVPSRMDSDDSFEVIQLSPSADDTELFDIPLEHNRPIPIQDDVDSTPNSVELDTTTTVKVDQATQCTPSDFIVPRLLTSRGIIKNVGFSIENEDILSESYNQGIEIIETRRLNRRIIKEDGSIAYVPSRTCLLTFQGRPCPKDLTIYGVATSIEPYIAPVRQCKNCLRFGYSQTTCRSSKRCAKCGLSHTDDPCPNKLECIYCGESHLATDRTCKEFERQKKINESMAFHDYSYYEASSIFPPLKPSNNQANFQRSAQAFPAINPPGQRNTNRFNLNSNISTPKNLSYSQTASLPAKRKRPIILQKPNAFSAEHNEMLLASTAGYKTSGSVLTQSSYTKTPPLYIS